MTASGPPAAAVALPPYTPRLVPLRRIANVINLSTPLGLVLAVLSRARFERGPYGVLVARCRPVRFLAPRAMAVTVGDVVLLRASDQALTRYPRVIEHEARHSAQWAIWFGPAGFVPAYLLSALWSWWHSGDFALRNPFERRAGLLEGGYIKRGG